MAWGAPVRAAWHAGYLPDLLMHLMHVLEFIIIPCEEEKKGKMKKGVRGLRRAEKREKPASSGAFPEKLQRQGHPG